MRSAWKWLVVSLLLPSASALPGCSKNTDVMAVRQVDAAVTIVAVEPAGIAGSVQPCPSGEAHPLVCCVGGPGVTPTCFEHTSSPFQQCPNDALAFPDGRSCCPLDGSSACTTAPTPSNASALDASSNTTDAAAVDVASCSFPCPPGAYSNTAIGFEATTPACSASELSQPEASCLYCCFDNGGDGGASCLSNACSCTGDHPCSCVPRCATCPAGWQPPSNGQFDLCCQPSAAGDGTTSCFSLSTLVSMLH
jgi:hypothetical protein